MSDLAVIDLLTKIDTLTLVDLAGRALYAYDADISFRVTPEEYDTIKRYSCAAMDGDMTVWDKAILTVRPGFVAKRAVRLEVFDGVGG